MMRLNPTVQYIPGKYLEVADALFHKPLPATADDNELKGNVEAHFNSIQAQWPASPSNLQEFSKATEEDEDRALIENGVSGWPKNGKVIPPRIAPYYNVCDDFSIVNGLLLYHHRIVMPKSSCHNILYRVIKVIKISKSAERGLTCQYGGQELVRVSITIILLKIAPLAENKASLSAMSH